ncbi:MAG: SseB family protein [Acidobacteria bacterium]|nr:SseB family protein [Acidobacteriota bacterium]
MGELQTQIGCWQRGEVSGERLQRAFVAHEDWLFFVAEGGVEKWRREGGPPDYVLRTDADGNKSLYIFSDAEAIKTYVKESGVTEWRCEVVTAAGADIFVSLPGDLTEVTVNPATPHAVSYRGEELKALREVAEADYVERELRSLSDGSVGDEDGLRRIVSDFRRYENFHLVSYLGGDGRWTYPRYAAGDGSNWVVAFTALDNANLYLKACAAELPGRYRVGRLGGEGLARIALALDGPGVLFNWEGYVKPLMLNSQFLQLVCDAQ